MKLLSQVQVERILNSVCLNRKHSHFKTSKSHLTHTKKRRKGWKDKKESTKRLMIKLGLKNMRRDKKGNELMLYK